MNTLNILLIEDSPDYSSLVLHWLSGQPDHAGFSLVWTDSLAAALARLQKGGIDLILLDLGLPDSDGVKTFVTIRDAQNNVPIIVLSSDESQALALQTIQLGAEDYLVKPTCTAELLARTLRHALARHGSTNRTRAVKPPELARVIGVLGGAGGVGTTTVACVLAAELRRHTEQAALLIDLDSSPGLAALAMGIDGRPAYTVQDFADNVDRLDSSLWEAMITRGPDHPDILASADSVAALVEPDTDSLSRIVSFAAKHYQWIVLDLGRLNGTSKRLLGTAGEFLVVSTPGISALRQCRQSIGLLNELGIEGDRVQLILNQLNEPDHWPRKELENLFGLPIAAVLPSAHTDLQDACIEKRLPRVTDGFRLALTGVARKMAGLPDERTKRPRRSLTSLADKFRRKQPEARLPGDLVSAKCQ